MVPGLSVYTDLRLTLPSFVVVVLRQRAEAAKLSMSQVVEQLILEDFMLDEMQAFAEKVPGFGESFARWMSVVVRQK